MSVPNTPLNIPMLQLNFNIKLENLFVPNTFKHSNTTKL